MAARTCSVKFIKAQTDLMRLHAYISLDVPQKHIFLNTTEIKKSHPPFPAVTTLLEYIIIHKHLLSQRHKVYNQTHAGFIQRYQPVLYSAVIDAERDIDQATRKSPP